MNTKRTHNEDYNLTPQQTSGPYVTLGLLSGEAAKLKNNNLLSEGGEGQEITVRGHLFSKDGEPLFNVLVEIWQANAKGVFNHPVDAHKEGFDPNFIGFGRDITNMGGYYEFKTIMPGKVSDIEEEGLKQAPNIIMIVHASGLSHPLYTRIYFEDQDHDDNFLRSLTEEQANTLIAKRVEDEEGLVYQFDMVFDGEPEDFTLESKLVGEEVDDVPDGSGRPFTYFYEMK